MDDRYFIYLLVEEGFSFNKEQFEEKFVVQSIGFSEFLKLNNISISNNIKHT